MTVEFAGTDLEDDGIRSDLDVVTDSDAAENFGPGTYDHMVAQRRMALASLFAGPSKRHALKEGDVLANLRRLPDHDAHAMIDEETFADDRGRMDFDAGQNACDLRNHAGQKWNVMGSRASATCDKPTTHETRHR